jgi:DNA-binding response OmpR family regulator
VSGPGATDPRHRIVLVVDDDASVRSLVGKALVAKGYEVLEATDGMHASEMLGRLPRSPDLIICDVMMPNVDGFTFARLVKARPELRGIPIIFLTAKTQAADVVRGIGLGARHYVQKPFSVKDLLDKVHKTIG